MAKFNPFLSSIELENKINSTAEVRGVFENIAGCTVLDGKFNRNNKIRIVRDGTIIHNDGKIESFKSFNREAVNGQQFDITVESFNDFKISDIIETY